MGIRNAAVATDVARIGLSRSVCAMLNEPGPKPAPLPCSLPASQIDLTVHRANEKWGSCGMLESGCRNGREPAGMLDQRNAAADGKREHHQQAG